MGAVTGQAQGLPILSALTALQGRGPVAPLSAEILQETGSGRSWCGDAWCLLSFQPLF